MEGNFADMCVDFGVCPPAIKLDLLIEIVLAIVNVLLFHRVILSHRKLGIIQAYNYQSDYSLIIKEDDYTVFLMLRLYVVREK